MRLIAHFTAAAICLAVTACSKPTQDKAGADLKAVGFQFLKDHPFGISPEPYATLPTTFPKYCKIWTKDDPIPSGAVGGM